MNCPPGSSGATPPHSQVWAGGGPLALHTPTPMVHVEWRWDSLCFQGVSGSHHPAGPFLPPILSHVRCAGRGRRSSGKARRWFICGLIVE